MASRPRWVDAIHAALELPENKGQLLYQLATVDSEGKPHVRTVGFREILQPEGDASLPLIVSVTDVRMPKVAHMRTNAYVELCWWMAGSRDQFRISGPVRIIPSPHAHPAAAVSGEPFLALSEMDAQGYDWEKKRVELFESLPPFMKATWCKPQPASVMESYEEAKKWPQVLPAATETLSEEDKQNREQALRNFALILIEAVEVDWAQVGTNPHQRTRFTRKGGNWVEEIIVP